MPKNNQEARDAFRAAQAGPAEKDVFEIRVTALPSVSPRTALRNANIQFFESTSEDFCSRVDQFVFLCCGEMAEKLESVSSLTRIDVLRQGGSLLAEYNATNERLRDCIGMEMYREGPLDLPNAH